MAIMTTDNRKAIFTVELPNGRVYTGSAAVVSISEERPVEDVYLAGDDLSTFRPGPHTWEIQLQGIGPLAVAAHAMFHELLEEGPTKSERWECPYCGRSWSSSKYKCWDGAVGCGASRPAMWWVK